VLDAGLRHHVLNLHRAARHHLGLSGLDSPYDRLVAVGFVLTAGRGGGQLRRRTAVWRMIAP
jgi:hypothetical protein